MDSRKLRGLICVVITNTDQEEKVGRLREKIERVRSKMAESDGISKPRQEWAPVLGDR
jgi:hypothetical protein